MTQNKKNFSNLILYGYKSSGKTYFGNLLAQEMKKKFIDTDQLVEEFYEKKCEKLDCRQISLKLGEKKFHELESMVIDSLDPKIEAIVSVGGGAVLNAENALKLSKLGKLVYLEVDKQTIKRRMFCQNNLPTFLDHNNLEASFETMYEGRMPIYTKLSEYVVKLDRKTDRQVLDELLILSSDII